MNKYYKNTYWFSLMELIVSVIIMLSMLTGFMYIIQSTFIFVDARKQEAAVFQWVEAIKAKMNQAFSYPGAKMIFSGSWVFSRKDTIADTPVPHLYDTVAISYNSGTVLMWVVNKETNKLIDPFDTNEWYFGFTEVASWETLSWVTFASGYVNQSVNITSFTYTKSASWEIVLVHIKYDNKIFDSDTTLVDTDSLYFSGETYFTKKIDF